LKRCVGGENFGFGGNKGETNVLASELNKMMNEVLAWGRGWFN
jgi:hypothetical protein